MKIYRRHMYEPDAVTFNAEAYTTNKKDVAWHVLGWELVADENTEWTGEYVQTGNVLAVMVGDDRVFQFDKEDLTPIDDYCGGCGQVGCKAESGVR